MASTPSRYEQTRCIRRGWLFERVGWIALAATAVGAGGGLFGDGLLSDSEASAGDELTVKYPRFCRAHAPLELVVDWLPSQPEAALSISRAYLDGFSITEIRPTPSAVSMDPAVIHYSFRTSEPRARARVTFTLKPEHAGPTRGRIGFADEREVEVRQFVFP